MDIAALIISILAFILSIIQYLRDSSREKKESTLNAYNELQKEAMSILAKYDTPMPEIEYRSKEWDELTDCLAKLESFSVGINTGIYSLDVLNRIGGSFFIHQYRQLNKIIKLKRKKNVSPGKHYDEFEKVAFRLIKYRKTKRKLGKALLILRYRLKEV